MDRDFPAVPVEPIKAAWKAEKLNRVIQLTISDCLGPCDLANVAMVLTPAGSQWFGLFKDDGPYEVLLTWAVAIAMPPSVFCRCRNHLHTIASSAR